MFKFNSARLIKNLEAVKSQYTSHVVSARVTVPPELSWWFYHEFGTATHNGGSGYAIPPRNGKGIVLPATGRFPEAVVLPFVGEPMTKNHPGVPALHYVRSSLERIVGQSRQALMAALHDDDYQFEAVHDALINKVMPDVIDIIAESMGEVLGGKSVGNPGAKLQGTPPEDVFHDAAQIVDQTT